MTFKAKSTVYTHKMACRLFYTDSILTIKGQSIDRSIWTLYNPHFQTGQAK